MSTFRCLVCREDLPPTFASETLRCEHRVCRQCQQNFWVHSVEKKCEPFPRCVVRGCMQYASYRELSVVLSPAVMRRVRHLQAIKPTRSIDGRRMYCVRPDCWEPLPPPVPSSLQPEVLGENSSEGLLVACPDCTQEACLLCGMAAHVGYECERILTSERQTRLYQSYAVGRVGACPHCGVHVEQDAGCNRVVCLLCFRGFDFEPFRSAADFVTPVSTERTENTPRIQATGHLPREAVMVIWFCIAGLSCLPTIFLQRLYYVQNQFWVLPLIVPCAMFAYVNLLRSYLIYLELIGFEVLLLVRHPVLAALINVFTPLILHCVHMRLCDIVLPKLPLLWVLVLLNDYLPPYLTYSLFLPLLLSIHLLLVLFRMLIRGRIAGQSTREHMD